MKKMAEEKRCPDKKIRKMKIFTDISFSLAEVAETRLERMTSRL